MHGSHHFQVYEGNLRRLMLLDWLRDEQLRRNAEVDVRRWRNEASADAPPFWIVMADKVRRRAAAA